jgi:hypothetical protein
MWLRGLELNQPGGRASMPSAQRLGIQLPRARREMPLKKRTISRAKRSTAMPGWTRSLAVGLRKLFLSLRIRVTDGVVARHYGLLGAKR